MYFWHTNDLEKNWNFVFQTLLQKGADINNRGDMELLMTEALLAPEKMPFAKLFMELGFAMNKYLTAQRLSQLFANSFRSCLYFRDVCFWVKGQSSKQSFRLKDVYDICYYFTSSRLLHKLQFDDLFVDPFRELFIWAVLSGHIGAANFFWQYASNQLILALISAELWKAIDSFLVEDCCNLSPKFQEARKNFLGKAYQLLQTAWETDANEAGKLISKKLETFGNKSVMDVAWFTRAKEFIDHPCFELVLQKQWTNGLRVHHCRVLVALVYPVSILHLNYTFSEESSVQPFPKISSIPWHDFKNKNAEENELEKSLEKLLQTSEIQLHHFPSPNFSMKYLVIWYSWKIKATSRMDEKSLRSLELEVWVISEGFLFKNPIYNQIGELGDSLKHECNC